MARIAPASEGERRKALLKAIRDIQEGREAPGLVRDPEARFYADFVCQATFIEDHEDGPSFCRRILGEKAAAE